MPAKTSSTQHAHTMKAHIQANMDRSWLTPTLMPFGLSFADTASTHALKLTQPSSQISHLAHANTDA